MPRRPEQPQLTSSPLEPDFPPFGITVLESHHADNFRMPMRSQPFLTMLYILRGRGIYETPDASTPCTPGDCVVVPIGQKYRITDMPSQSLSLFVLCIKPSVVACEPQLLKSLPAGRLALDDVTAARLSRDVRQMLYEQSKPGSPSRPAIGTASTMASLALSLLAHLARHREVLTSSIDQQFADIPADQRVARYIARLDQRFFEPQSLDEAAASTSLSRRRFTSLFREAAGCTWLDYLHNLRIEHAKQLLSQTDRTVTSIAFECGFDDLSSFYRLFKRFEEQSPDQWRKKRKRS